MRTSSKARWGRSSASSLRVSGCRSCQRCSRSRASRAAARTPPRWRSCERSGGALGALGRADLREDAERRLADGQLAELRVDAPELVAASDVGALDLRVAHRQRLAIGPNSTEARGPGFGFLQELEVDLDGEHPLHAPDVGAADLLERVEERTRPSETGGREHDLVAVDPAPATLDLVLRAERQAPRTVGRWWLGR